MTYRKRTTHGIGTRHRRGKILTMFTLLLPAVLGVLGLVFDGGLLFNNYRHTQHAADAAATAAAMELMNAAGPAQATATAESFVHTKHAMGDAVVTVSIPPSTGKFAGRDGYVEVTVTRNHRSYLMTIVGSPLENEYNARAVAGWEDSTADSAIVILDPSPAPITTPAVLPVLPSPNTSLAGLEIEGAGEVSVDGAVLANTTWGDVDQEGDIAGVAAPPSYGMMCMPALPLTKLRARDIRVAGGVDAPSNYGHYDPAQPSPLRCNCLPTPDPLAALPVPTLAADASNVLATNHGGVRVANVPIISPPEILSPGVYDWIEIVSGTIVFQPGVYVIRGVNPDTQIALDINGGQVTAEGVMFYITNTTTYDVANGMPDAGDGETEPAAPGEGTIQPSVVIADLLAGSSFSPLNDSSSPFDGMVLFQRRQDRRPMVIAQPSAIPGGGFSGRTYAKWGHVTLVASGQYDATFATGTMRVVTALASEITPSSPLPPATDVVLVE